MQENSRLHACVGRRPPCILAGPGGEENHHTIGCLQLCRLMNELIDVALRWSFRDGFPTLHSIIKLGTNLNRANMRVQRALARGP